MIEKYSFVDKSFNAKDIANYHLSLQVFLKGFSFCILDRQRNKFIALSHYQYNRILSYKVLLQEIKEIVESEAVLSHSFQHVKLLFGTPKSTLVPSAFYDKGNSSEYFDFNHELKSYEQIQSNYIYGNSSHVLYALPVAIQEYFESMYAALKVYHQACPFIEEVLLKNKAHTDSSNLYLNIFPDFFDVLWLNNGELELYNSFAYKTHSDFHYFVLNVFDQLKLNSREIPLYISGFINKNDERIEHLKGYVQRIEFIGKPDHFEFSYGFNDFPEHFFTNMINLYQCG